MLKISMCRLKKYIATHRDEGTLAEGIHPVLVPEHSEEIII